VKPDGKTPADLQRYPPGCPDPDWCSGNRVCYWACETAGWEEWDMPHEPPTPAERDALRKDMSRRVAMMGRALEAIRATGYSTGTIPCPMCGMALQFTVARSNGHI
jgi:hypothetical protein